MVRLNPALSSLSTLSNFSLSLSDSLRSPPSRPLFWSTNDPAKGGSENVAKQGDEKNWEETKMTLLSNARAASSMNELWLEERAKEGVSRETGMSEEGPEKQR